MTGHPLPSDKDTRAVAATYDRLSPRYRSWADAVTPPLRVTYTHRLLAALDDGAAVLEVGCGPGVPVAELLARRFDVLGLDVSAAMVDAARAAVPSARFVVGDVVAQDFEPERFDAIVAFHSIIHVPRARHREVFAKFHDWLRPGGLFVASLGAHDVPEARERDWLGGGEMFWSFYDAETNLRMISDVGLVIDVATVEHQTEPGDAPVEFLWVVARKPVAPETQPTTDDIEFLDTVRAVPEAAARKAGVATRLGVQKGDLVLEVGPGTGEDLQRLASAAGPGGFGIGVELDGGLAAEAKRRAREQRNVAFVVGDVRHLPLRTDAFDAVYVERVLQHVPDVEAAMGEIGRVLGAGARALVFEPDQDLRAIDHPDRDTEAVLRRRAAGRFANPSIGRRIFGLLVDAGFVDVGVAGTVTCRGEADIDAATAVAEAVNDGEIDAEVGDAYLAEVDARRSRGAGFTIWVAFEAAARRPDSADS